MTSILKVDQLQDSGGNAIITSDGAGSITTASGLNTAITNAGFVTSANAGKVLQVVQGSTITQTVTTNTTTTDTTLSASITPSSASNKILVTVAQSAYHTGSSSVGSGSIFLVRNSTTIGNTGQYALWSATYNGATPYNPEHGTIYSIVYLDSPATTSSITYKTQQRLRDGNRFETQRDGSHTSYIILMEIGA